MLDYEVVMTRPSMKIRPPQLRVVVPRPRLAASLDAAASAGLVALVVAPGGTGKTSLVADWARHAPGPVAWYSLDHADRDPRRLVEGLCTAIDAAFPGSARQAFAALAGSAQEATVAGLLLDALDGHPFTLVVDDFQHLEDAPDCMVLWDHILRFRPSDLTLIVLSRTVPVLGFAALAAFDQLMGLGFHDLSFTDDEADALLNAYGFDAHNAASFVARSGGWAAGVLLQALVTSDSIRVLHPRTEVLMDHLGGEILATLPADLRVFLLASACLGPASPTDADAILHRDDSMLCYAKLDARGLFLEQEGDVYRYHDLFAEYLVGQLKREDPEAMRGIRRATADWWAARGDLPRALGVLAIDSDWEALAALLDRERVTLWTHGLGGTVLMHMERLPRDYHTPRLLALCGHVRAQRGEHNEALALADAGMAAATDDEEWLSPAVLRVQALVYAQRDEEAVRSATAVLVVAQRIGYERAVTNLRELRGATQLRMGRLAEGRDDLEVALAVHRREGNENGEARTLFNLATQLIMAGHITEVETPLSHADAVWRRIGNTASRSNVLHSTALLLCAKGDYERARLIAEQARDMAHEGGYPLVECEAIATLAHIHANNGQVRDAERLAISAITMATRLDLVEVLNDAWRARITVALLRRDRAAARDLIDEARPFAITAADKAQLDVLSGTLALRSHAHQRAVSILDDAAKRLESANRPHQAAQAHLLSAESLLSLGRVRRAEEALNRAAGLVMPLGSEGYLRVAARFTHQVAANLRLLRHLHSDTRRLLDRIVDAAPRLALMPTVDVPPVAPLLHLSPFGQGRIVFGGEDVALSALPPKARELLFFAGRATIPPSRDEIIDALWDGDMSSVSAFWNATRHLRRVFGDDAWGRQNGKYTLRMPVVYEEHRFAALVERVQRGADDERIAAAEEALSIVDVGGYLDWCESLWAMTARNRTTHEAVGTALTLAQLYESLGRYDDAVSACRRAAAFDPLDEDPRHELMQYLARMGNLCAARREYKTYEKLVRVELDSEPSSALQALAVTLA